MEIELFLDSPELVAPNPLDREVKRAIEDELKEMEKRFNRFTRSWSDKSQPKWAKDVYSRADGVFGIIHTSDKPFDWVARGTKKRFAILRGKPSGRYKRKSVPGSLRAFPGGPYSVYLIKNADRAKEHPIVARNPHLMIADLRQKPFERRLQRAFDIGAARMFIGNG